MAIRIRDYCISATLLATTVASAAFANTSDPDCLPNRVREMLFPTPDCAIDRSAPAMHGPFSMEFFWSDKLEYTVDLKYINDLGPSDALSLEFDIGTKEFRFATTWGHAFTNDLFFKASLDYLAQKTEFNFLSGSDELRPWMGQWAFGADLRYRLANQLGVDSVHIAFEYINAEDLDLVSKPFSMGGPILINHRAIRGVEDISGILGFRAQPWSSGYFDVDLIYDGVSYNRIYSPPNNEFGLGGAIAFHQNLGERFQFVLSGTNRKLYYEYIAGFKYIARHSSGSLLELGLEFSVDGNDDAAFGRENKVGIGIFYSWGGDMYAPPVIYADRLNRGLRQEVLDYTNEPVIRTPQVLVRPDETFD